MLRAEAGRPPIWPRLRLIAPTLLLLLGVSAVIGSIQLDIGSLRSPGPGLWPLLAGATVTLFSLILLAFDAQSDYEPWDRQSIRVALGIVGLAVFILIFQYCGVLLAAFLMLLVWLRLLAEESWRLAIVAAAVGATTIYVLFGVLLQVPFPDDIVISLIGLKR